MKPRLSNYIIEVEIEAPGGPWSGRWRGVWMLENEVVHGPNVVEEVARGVRMLSYAAKDQTLNPEALQCATWTARPVWV